MKASTRNGVVMIGWLALLGAGNALAADWPQWRGTNGDAKVTDFKPPESWPKQLTQKWNVAVGAGDATPALVGNRLYVFSRQGADEITSCLDAETGKVIWQDKFQPGVSVIGPAAQQHPGPRSSPAVADGKVITLGVSGVLSCFDAESGKMLWRKDPYKSWPQFFAASSPIIVDGMCIAQLGGRGGGAVVAFDLANGDEKWKAEQDGPAYATPAVMTAGGVKQLVAQTDKSLIGVGLADGKILWQLPAPPQRMSQNAVTPIIDGEVVIYSGQGKGTAAIKIEKQGDAFAPKELWTNADISSGFATPVLKDGLLFGLSNKASFFCLDAKTGKTLWTAPARRGERGFGSIVDAGQTILALTPSAELIALKPSDKEYSELANVKVPDAQPYAYPVVAGNRVFIKGQDSVSLFTIE
jgi:outer membrane protein assembly factor BamB